MENVFGIMYERFAIFQKLIALDTGKVENFALTACALHIFLRTKCQDMYMPTGSTDRRIWKVTLRSMLTGALALIPRVTSLVYQVREETGQV